MIQKTKSRTDTREAKFARWDLAIETLSAAIHKDRSGMMIALLTIEECRLLSSDELAWLRANIDRLQDVDTKLSRLYATLVTKEGARKVWEAHFRAKTLVDEIAVQRESAFWLLNDDGVLTVEKLIGEQMRVYRDVRTILRSLVAKVAEGEPHADPTQVPDIPANQYLAITHPELVA